MSAAHPRGVLIVAYSYPPRGGVGSLRAVRLARRLAALGWKVCVLTAEGGGTSLARPVEEGLLPGVEVLPAPYVDRVARLGRWVRLGRGRGRAARGAPGPAATPRRSRLWRAVRSILLFPDEHSGWIRGATRRGLARLRDGDLGVILSTSPPESAHLIAAMLKAASGVRWVADFRDPWAFSHLREPSWLDPLHARAEARALRSADALVTVSRGWSQRFRALYPGLRHALIRNGFDCEAAESTREVRGDHFRIVYTGKLDPVQQDPRLLFRAVAAALHSGAIPAGRMRLAFYCYGDTQAEIHELALHENLGDSFEWGGALDPQTSRSRQEEADVLVLFCWKRDPCCVPAKLFDYLGVGRRILVLGPRDGEAAGLVHDAGRGVAVEAAKECEALLVGWYQEWSREGRLEAGGNAEVVQRHSFEERASEYSRLLDEILAGTAGSTPPPRA